MIETERLVLRAPQAEDLPWQLAWLNTPAVMRHMGGEVRSVEEVTSRFERNAAAFAAGEPAFWTLVLRDSGEVIGRCGLSRIAEQPAPPAILGAIQVGWALAEPYWGQGLAREAARAAITYGFTTFDVEEIWAQTSDANRASTRLMGRLGMVRCPELAYPDPDYPPIDNPTMVHRLGREQWAAWA